MQSTMDPITKLAALEQLSIKSQAILGAAVVLLFFYLAGLRASATKRLRFPVVKASFTDYISAMIEGTLKVMRCFSLFSMLTLSLKYPNTPFIIGDIVMLPASTVDEVRNLPENRVSMSKMLVKSMYTEYTGLAVDNIEVIKALKIDLTRYISNNLDGLRDEMMFGFDKELGCCEDWTSIYLYQKLVRVIAMMSGRIFVGLPLCREKEWIETTVTYTEDIMIARELIALIPTSIRRFTVHFLPAVRRLKHYAERGATLLKPLIEEYLARESSEKSCEDADVDNGFTMVHWMLNYMDNKSVQEVSRNQMALSFAAIHTTTVAACQAIFDLVCRPEYIKALRDEIQQVVNEDGYDDGIVGRLKKQSISKLRKLDSFLKESQRFSAPGLTSLDRVTTAPLELSTGHTIPEGVHIAFPAHAISLSPKSAGLGLSNNPNPCTPPHEFDGLRFSKLRDIQGNENKVYPPFLCLL